MKGRGGSAVWVVRTELGSHFSVCSYFRLCEQLCGLKEHGINIVYSIFPRSNGFLALWKKWNADDADLYRSALFRSYLALFAPLVVPNISDPKLTS